MLEKWAMKNQRSDHYEGASSPDTKMRKVICRCRANCENAHFARIEASIHSRKQFWIKARATVIESQ